MHSATGEQPLKTTRQWLPGLWATVFGLQTKATALVVGLMLLTAGVMYGLSMRTAWKLTNRLEREQALQHAILVANLAAQAQQRDDHAALQQVATDSASGDSLEFVIITDSRGRVLASAGKTAEFLEPEQSTIDTPGKALGVPFAVRLPKSDTTFLDLTYPITAADRSTPESEHDTPELLGYVRIGVNRDRTTAELRAATDLVTGVGCAIVLLAVPLGFFVVRRIVVPLNELSDVAHRFSAGDLKARSSVTRTDEIGALAKSFNHMADEVARTHEEILTLNEELEARVLERTSQLRELVVREPLTGLYNRRHFSEVLAHQFAEAKRYKQDLSLVMIDLDDFKNVNDGFGHPTGDEILILVALTVAAQLRGADVAARLGGDEFIILMPQSNAADAHALGARIAERFEEERSLKYPDVDVSLSIGIACLSETQSASDDDLIRQADRALYKAKDRGKARIVLAGGPPVQ